MHKVITYGNMGTGKQPIFKDKDLERSQLRNDRLGSEKSSVCEMELYIGGAGRGFSKASRGW